MSREYFPGELEGLVFTVNDLLRQQNLSAAHRQDVVGANSWLSKILDELTGKTDPNWKASVEETIPADRAACGESTTPAKMVTFRIETPGFQPGVPARFHFKENAAGNFVLIPQD